MPKLIWTNELKMCLKLSTRSTVYEINPGEQSAKRMFRIQTNEKNINRKVFIDIQ